MAEKTPKARVRKTAPTVREKAQAAQAKAEKPKSNRRQKVLVAAKKPFKVVRIPSNPVTRFLGKVGRGTAKGLRFIAPKYLINSWREVRLVTWPGRTETWRLTLAVIIFAIIFGSLVFGVDKIIDILFKKLVLK